MNKIKNLLQKKSIIYLTMFILSNNILSDVLPKGAWLKKLAFHEGIFYAFIIQKQK